MPRDSQHFLCALQRRRCTTRSTLSTAYHRARAHPRVPLGRTTPWEPSDE